MGVIDKICVELSCEKCGAEEKMTALDTGSGWGGPSWDELGPFSKFNAEITGGGKEDPRVKLATCKGCGQIAKIEWHYQT